MFEMQLFGKNVSRLGQMPAVILRILRTHGLKTDILLVHLCGTAKAADFFCLTSNEMDIKKD